MDRIKKIVREILTEKKKKKKKKADRCLRIARRKIPKSSAYRSGNIERCRQGSIWKDLKETDNPQSGKAAPYGSGYSKLKDLKKEQIYRDIEESLNKWFKDKWVRINTSGEISGECGTMKKGKPTTRCLPKKKAQSLTKAQRKATTAKKVKGSKKGKQWVKNTKKAKNKKKN